MNKKNQSSFAVQFNAEIETNKLGVPHGSMLGSLFFVTYMNDKDTSCDHFHNICYAHNTAHSINRGKKLN